MSAIEPVNKSRRVMVIYGRNTEANKALFSFLYSIGLDPIEWEEAIAMTGEGSPYIGNVLDHAFDNAQAALVFLTGDDVARLGRRYHTLHDPPEEKRLTPQARPNVVFEMGMAFGRYPERTIIVALGHTRPLSDTVGRHIIHLSNSAASRKKVAERLKVAGCSVNVEHKEDWLTTGDFDLASNEPDSIGLEKQAGFKITRRYAMPEDTATYKPKVWVQIRNDSGACVEIRHLGWTPSPLGIQLKFGPPSMQLKIGKSWCPKEEGVEHLHVPSGETFRVWVQPGAHDMKDLEQRCQSDGRIGILSLRVNDAEVQIHV
jgi:hypothetical protein